MMKTQVNVVVWCFLLLVSTFSFAGEDASESACARFAGNGVLAEVSIRNGSLHLRVVDAGKSQDAPSRQVNTETSNCELFFSADNQWLAIGTEHAVGNSWSVRVHVWNVRKAEWHGQFEVDPKPGLTGYVSLAGFFQKEDKLVITGKQDNTRNAPLASMLVSTEGKVLDGPDYARDAPANVDAEGNRVWSSTGTDGCLMSPAPLIGTLVRGSDVNRPAIQGTCAGPSPVGFPGQNTIIGVTADGDGRTWAWRISVDTNSSAETSLPAPPKTHADKWVQATVQPFLSISPDGQFFAVQRTTTHWNHSDSPRATENEVIVAGVQPLKFVGLVKSKSCSSVSAFAVNNHVGSLEVVGRWCGEWKTDTVAVRGESNGSIPKKQ